MKWLSRRKSDLRAPLARRVRDLEILSARLIRSGFAGDYHSAFHGKGIEFSQVREYQPGDDIRTIDWNVTARSGVPHVKEFVEERDLTVLVAVDVSGSMGFGSLDWRKCDLAAELTAVFAFSAVQNSDRVGLLLFSNARRTYIPPQRGRTHAQVLVRAVAREALQGTGGVADFDVAVSTLERLSSKRAVVIVLSDFLDPAFERPLRRLNRRHDVVAIVIGDPREDRFPGGGLVRLIDAESGERRMVELDSAEVSRRAVTRHGQTARCFQSSAIDALSLSTAASYDRDLLRFFRERSARRR